MPPPDRFEERYRQLRGEGAAGWNAAGDDADVAGWALALLDAAQAPRGGAVLELGCGAGNISRALGRAGYSVCGVDVSPSAIAWARADQPSDFSAVFCVADLTRSWSPIPARPYAAILDSLLLHCLTGAARRAFLGGLAAHMTEAQAFLVMTMCGTPRVPALAAAFDSASFTVQDRGVAVNHIAPAEAILDEMRSFRLEPCHIRIEPARDPARDVDMLLAVARKTR